MKMHLIDGDKMYSTTTRPQQYIKQRGNSAEKVGLKQFRHRDIPRLCLTHRAIYRIHPGTIRSPSDRLLHIECPVLAFTNIQGWACPSTIGQRLKVVRTLMANILKNGYPKIVLALGDR